jgi:1-acyl-sn-glycerol-3-phosphate acyltransferase
MLGFFKTITIFIKTFYYLVVSYLPHADINALKKKWGLSVLQSFGLHLRVIGENPSENNLVLVGNHIGFLDIVVLTAVEPRAVFLSKAEVANWPVIGACAKRLGTLFVNRESSNSRAAAKLALAERLKNSNSTYLAGFPSGTTTLTEDIPWKKGLIQIAAETNTKVQVFKMKYNPARVCAYIDDDTLFSSMSQVFNTPHKSVLFEWGPCENITDVISQTQKFQQWTQTSYSINGEKTLNRLAHSFKFQ